MLSIMTYSSRYSGTPDINNHEHVMSNYPKNLDRRSEMVLEELQNPDPIMEMNIQL